jgi:hypothetical protein
MVLILAGLVVIILAGSIASARHPLTIAEQLFYGAAMICGLGLIVAPLVFY